MFGPRINWVPLVLLLLVMGAVASFILIDFKLESSILEVAKSKAQINGVEAVNEAVSKKIVSRIEYKDIVYVHKDNSGKIVLIQPNTLMLNSLITDTVIEVSKSLEKLEENSISIPLGQLSGIKLLAGYGPKMKVKIIAVPQVNVKVLNKFDQAGINQSRHLIYLEIDSRIKIAVPFLDDEVKVLTTIPLAETIIVGDVPRTYVNLDGQKGIMYPLLGE
ncbi:MAG: sporulation protein YunB [Syntrophomonas sp.]